MNVCSSEPSISKIEKDILELRGEHRLLKIQMAGLKDELDALEQYSRRNCLILHGIPEEKGESTTKAVLDVIHKKVIIPEEKVTSDIDRSHRLGKAKPTRETRSNKSSHRPIIVKFKGYDSRNAVFSTKKTLKGSKVMVTENLRPNGTNCYKKCIITLGKGKVWTYDGR